MSRGEACRGVNRSNAHATEDRPVTDNLLGGVPLLREQGSPNSIEDVLR